MIVEEEMTEKDSTRDRYITIHYSTYDTVQRVMVLPECP